jgi:hypothetical protein
MQVKKPKTELKLKYDNRMMVSYPKEIYEGVRKWSYRKGISMQEFQRKCAEFYISVLEQDNIDFKGNERENKRRFDN